MRTLVTGGAGFIGSHLVEALVRDGHDVVVIDDCSRGKIERLPSMVTHHSCSVTDPAVPDIIASTAPAVIFHLAAQIDVRVSMSDPLADTTVNVLGTVNVLQAASSANVPHVIFSSSGGTVYGDTHFIPTPEQHPYNPTSFYGAAKRTGELYGEMVSRNTGLKFAALRYGNVYGPRQDPHGEAGVVAIFCQRLLNKTPAVIHGAGTQTRDYVYVGDVVKANLLAWKHGVEGSYNIGTATETDVNEIYATLAGLLHVSTPAEHDEPRPGEQLRSCLDITEAKRTFGWEPTVSIQEGFAATVEYFRSEATTPAVR